MHVFDLDDTLATPDKEMDRKYFFMTIDHLKPIPSMIKLFNNTKTNHPTMILTTRHPELKKEIREKFDCEVECRNFCLTWSEIFEALRTDENLKKFMSQMISWKTSVLNQLADDYQTVIFYDDLVHRYDKSRLKNNIYLKKPLYISDGKQPPF